RGGRIDRGSKSHFELGEEGQAVRWVLSLGRSQRGAFAGALAAALLAGLAGTSAFAQQRADEVPAALKHVGVEEHLEAAIPLQLAFKDEQGNDVALGSYFRAGHPVLITLNYYRCPMLCTLELNGLVKGLKDLAWTAGDEFQIVTVSIDSRETPELA